MMTNKTVNMYSLQAPFEFRIQRDNRYYSIVELCKILKDTFEINLDDLVNKSRGKLHGEKFGL